MRRADNIGRFYSELWPHRAVVLRSALFLTRSEADADDLAQETMLKAFKALDTLRDQTNPRAWLLTILRYTHIDRLRAKDEQVSLDQLEYDIPSDPAHAASAAEPEHDPDALLENFSDHEVIQALRELPREIRWTLLLVDVEGLPHDQAAEVLQIPVGTVKSRLHRGRKMLFHSLQSAAR
jgi:RNA polymerase sigma-70 factor (ECF subfamily)